MPACASRVNANRRAGPVNPPLAERNATVVHYSRFCVRALDASSLQTPAQATPVKNSGSYPFSGSVGATATHTIHSRNEIEMYETARKSFARFDHAWFTKCVIFRAVS